MNIKKIESLLIKVSDMLSEETLNNAEYMIFIANLLITFGKVGLKTLTGFEEMNIEDAHVVELALNQNPNNPFLASILTGHTLIKWSEGFEKDDD